MKVVRKYIPLLIRIEVAQRQALQMKGFNLACHPTPPRAALMSRLAWLLVLLFQGKRCELHHRPALENRVWNARKKDYDPPANDPNFLVYLLKDEEHKIETYVRGVRGQLSDAGLRRKNKRMAENRKRATRFKRGAHFGSKTKASGAFVIKAKDRHSRPIPQRRNPWPKNRKLGWKR